MPVLDDDLRRTAEEIVARYPSPRSAMLPLLYLVQSVQGHVTREGMQEIAGILDVTTAEVEAVVTFYTMLKRRPTGKWVLSVCTNVSCAVVGGRRLYERAREAVGEDHVTADGQISIEEGECLGACDAAPVVQVNYCNYDRVTEEQLLGLVEKLRADDPPPPARGPAPRDHAATSRILAGLGDDRG